MASTKRLLCIALAAALLPLAACGGSKDNASGTPTVCPPGTATEAEYDPTAILRYGSVPAASLDPIRQVEANEIVVLQTIFDPLVKLDDNGNPIPGLATSWSLVSPDVMEFKLREGVTFQDGTPFNADAVAFNIDRAKNDKESTIAGTLANVTKVDVVDEHTVRFTMDPPNPAALPIILSDRAGLMASPTAVRSAGSSAKFSAAPVGAGPYKLEGQWFARERVSVRAWDGYWDAKQRKLGGIDFIETSSDASLSALQAGDLDVQYLDDDKVAAACADDRLRVMTSSTNELRLLIINQSMTPFQNLKVRQAIWYALDRKAIADALTNGQAEVASGWFPKNSIAYAPDLADAYPYDPDKAKQLLAEAGYPDGLKFSAEIGGTFTAYVRMGELIQAQLKEVGITMDLKLIDPGQMLSRLYGTGGSKAEIASSPLAAPPARQPSTRFKNRFFSDGVYNPSHVELPGIRDLVAQADAATDDQQRAQFFQQAQKLAVDQVAGGIPLFFVPGHTAMAAYVGGVTRGSTRSNMTFDGLYITKGHVPVGTGS